MIPERGPVMVGFGTCMSGVSDRGFHLPPSPRTTTKTA
jgi:hypothetical protein